MSLARLVQFATAPSRLWWVLPSMLVPGGLACLAIGRLFGDEASAVAALLFQLGCLGAAGVAVATLFGSESPIKTRRSATTLPSTARILTALGLGMLSGAIGTAAMLVAIVMIMGGPGTRTGFTIDIVATALAVVFFTLSGRFLLGMIYMFPSSPDSAPKPDKAS